MATAAPARARLPWYRRPELVGPGLLLVTGLGIIAMGAGWISGTLRSLLTLVLIVFVIFPMASLDEASSCDARFAPSAASRPSRAMLADSDAFDEMERIGLIGSKRPRMIAVQAAGCAPMVRAWENGEEFAERWEGAATMAIGIRVPKAVGDFLILQAVRESGGAAIAALSFRVVE